MGEILFTAENSFLKQNKHKFLKKKDRKIYIEKNI